ncbi:carbon catabolite repressor protein 4 homolog 4-like isoform X1 [Chenopodium quinoa]|uniref:carbon catabolite repressor protein 4 homolog 4-like isoform X1 n=1 Tax=Chenopodium quinoa TaxID=63459 RepID=UPI000B791D72|nr:carbon catabolite repressor protein 4 homolog 4-like isoform X1 [Chenopodium quinoa]
MLKTLSLFPRLPFSSSRRFPNFATMSVEAVPLCPKFVPVEQSKIISISSSEAYKFSVVSYNILAQVFVKSSYFPHSPKPCLRWKARSKAVLTVLGDFDADFLCLQELDEYDSFYRGNMERLGYSSIYIQRSGQKRDGCGIFYKLTSAELVLQENIEYNDLVKSIDGETNSRVMDSAVSVAGGNANAEETQGSTEKGAEKDRGDPNDPRVRLKRDCVGIMAAFRLENHSQHLIIIANTHLYWDPKWADVKLAQAKYLLSRLDQFKTLVSEKFECIPSVILTGDFNSTPGDQVYNYLISGSSSSESRVECPDELPIPLSSVYACTRGEPAFTNCTPGFTGTLDYIFFSPSGCIQPVSFLELPDEDSPSVAGGLPNYQHPSDHLPIGAEFQVHAQ